jgi:predicted PurR-regulated permease PerM
VSTSAAQHLPYVASSVAAPEASAQTSVERRPAIRLVPALLVIVGLWWGQVVLIPLVLSVLISYALEPFVSRLVALHIPRPLAVLVLLLTVVVGGGVGIYSLRGEAASFIEQLPDAARTVRQALQPARRDQPGPVAKVQQAARELEKAAADAAGPRAGPPRRLPIDHATKDVSVYEGGASRRTGE